MLAYQNISITLRDNTKFEEALIAAKNMLQVAWFTKSETFEIYAYDQIGKCYFYLQNIKKATEYNERFINGILEYHNSSERLNSTTQFESALKLKKRQGKFVRAGGVVLYGSDNKKIDLTVQDYKPVWPLISEINNWRLTKNEASIKSIVNTLTDYNMTCRNVLASTPLL